ncbi:hypothetical protein AVEN_263739-1 [Araneus ventricosus]|uniref:Uncharacterized protein n=1 Tax=Araneus ventricosus TaxID=182803 RepID=A0A4Y2AS95_ARAVE|nr:hypothetical protein AVEN_263739-1 [Araneus ventricosus]
MDNPGKSRHAPTQVVSTNSIRSGDFILMQDGAPPHFHHEVRQYLNDIILTPCYFYLWVYIKESVYVPPMPATLQDFPRSNCYSRGFNNQGSITPMWQEMDYR